MPADPQRLLQEVIRDHVDRPLRAVGFRRRGNEWHRDKDPSLVPIVRHSRLSRDYNSVEFVLDWSIFSSKFCRRAFAALTCEPSFHTSPFAARLVPAGPMGDQWWRLSATKAWVMHSDGTETSTDFSEIDAGISRFLRRVSEIHTLSDLRMLTEMLLDRAEASETFTLHGSVLELLADSD